MHLTPTEFALLRELATNRGKSLTHAHLLRRVWGRGYETETEYLRVYVRRLRSKLEVDGEPPLIITQPRVGYRLVGRVARTHLVYGYLTPGRPNVNGTLTDSATYRPAETYTWPIRLPDPRGAAPTTGGTAPVIE